MKIGGLRPAAMMSWRYSRGLRGSVQLRRSRRPIVIASRRSRLARAQAELVGQALSRLNPGIELRYVWIESEGDRRPDASLSSSGGKGLFVRGIEQALLDERADLAVHSLKDLPADLTPGLAIAATPRREDVRDCLIARTKVRRVQDLPPGAVVGTSGPRRAAQIKRLRLDLVVQPIRGNIETRLAKVLEPDTPTCDATLLAMAGLHRAALREHAVAPLALEDLLPAAGQGALAIQCRTDDHVAVTRCLPLNDPLTASSVHAERAIVAGLSGDCHSPIAVYAEPVGPDRFRIRARVLSPDGTTCLDIDQTTSTKLMAKLARAIVKDLQARGADTIMRGISPAPRDVPIEA